MTRALIAGTGGLPAMVAARWTQPLIVCALEGVEPALPVAIRFRIERLGGFLNDLKAKDVTEICMAGALVRPPFHWRALDLATLPLLPQMLLALRRGDDGALRAVIALIEQKEFTVVAAQDIAPDLLPPAGVMTQAQPTPQHEADARLGMATLAEMGRADSGQACLINNGIVVASEGPDGTDAMIAAAGPAARGGILFKGPKPGQDRRVDWPVIGVQTVETASRAGLAGIVVTAGGVMVLDQTAVCAALDARDMFLWVRAEGAA